MRIKLVVRGAFAIALTATLVWIIDVVWRAALYTAHTLAFMLIKHIRMITVNIIVALGRLIVLLCPCDSKCSKENSYH